MKRKHFSYLFLILATVILGTLLFAVGHGDYAPIKEKFKHEIHEKKADTIKTLLFYHAADYFVYQGSVVGFQYDLLQRLGKYFQKPLSITIESDPEKAFLECFSNDYDIVGFDFDKSLYTPMYITESDPHSYTYPVLLMRKGTIIDTNTTHVVYASSRYSNEIDFSILPNPKQWKFKCDMAHTVEDLVGMLEDTLIDYLVCNYNVAITILPFYKNLTLGPRIGKNFPRTWVLNSAHQNFNDSINRWLCEYKMTEEYKKLCTKYLMRHSYVIEHSFGNKRNKISSYDPIIKSVCARRNVDWRFMSSIIYQESHFSSDVLGLGGSFGIMQMMPATRETYGITDTSSVEDQLVAGARYIAQLYRIFEHKVDSSEIYYYVAGAYNAGPGHILDAMNLCKKYDDNPKRWASVSKYLILKSQKEYYSDPVVNCGYYPGKHTVNYVREVMTRYNGYVVTKSEK